MNMNVMEELSNHSNVLFKLCRYVERAIKKKYKLMNLYEINQN